MTTRTDSSTAGYYPGPGGGARPRPLRRSQQDRMVTGVAGGLGEYFGVDAVIFRVLFAVLSFFGGVGLLMYGLAWLLMPEPGVEISALDRAIAQLRLHRVPPWLVIVGGALVLWIGWFSWWAPGPTFPAVVLLAVLALVLVRRLGSRPVSGPRVPYPWQTAQPPYGQPPSGQPPFEQPQFGQPPSGSQPEPAAQTPVPTPPMSTSVLPVVAEPASTNEGHLHAESATAPQATSAGSAPPEPGSPGDSEFGAFNWRPAPPATDPGNWNAPSGDSPNDEQSGQPLIAPLSDTRRSMQAWFAEAAEAHRRRVESRRPIKVGVALALIAGWAVVALMDAFGRVLFPAYIWVGLAVLTTGLLASLITRRLTLSLLFPMAALAVVAFGLGGTQASLSDGSGQIGWMPTSAGQLVDHREFAGQSTLDLTRVGDVGAHHSIRIDQAAGEVVLRIPNSLDVTVISDVHSGDIRDGQSRDTGRYVGGLNVHLELPPASGATGAPLTVHVNLAIGHVQIDRVAG